MLDSTVTAQVQETLDSFNTALEDGDAQAASAMFTTDSYWRDLVAVTWNLKTVEGPSGVQGHADGAIAACQTARLCHSGW